MSVATENLPEWAEVTRTVPGLTQPVVDVDADAMYESFLAEYRALYAEDRNIPGEWRKSDGELRKEWADCLESLNADDDEVCAYWCEVCYQSMKLDLQMALRTFNFEIHVHTTDRRFRQADRPRGRGPENAAGGLGGGTEARQHYKRLRGFMPG